MKSLILKRINIEIFILNIIPLGIIIDMINGILIRQGLLVFRPSQVYRSLILLFVIIIFFTRRQKFFLGSFILVTIVFIFIHMSDNLFSIKTVLVDDVMFIGKLISVIILTIVFSQFKFLETSAGQKKVRWIFQSSAILLAFNVVLSILGLGYEQYSSGGFKGFIFSGNEFAVTYFIIASYLIFDLFITKKKAIKPGTYIFTVVILVIGFIQGMKTLLLGLILSLFVIPLIFFKKEMVVILKLFFLIIISIPLIIIILNNSLILDRFVYFNQQSGIVGLVSDRDKFLQEALNIYMNEYTFSEKIFGKGVVETKYKVQINSTRERHNVIEIDFLDLILYFGIIAIIYYLLWFSIILLHVKRCFYNKSWRVLMFLNIILIIISILAGHVIYSGMLAIYWALINNLYRVYQDEY